MADTFTVPPLPTGGYQSPLMQQMHSTGQLTLDLLNRLVPIFQAGEAARAQLADPDATHTREQLDIIDHAIAEGDAAKETLVLAGIPLVKHLARKEYERRQNWHSQVTLDDLVQEGVGGFIRGLRAYNPNGGQKSPTNYLGQWVLTDMRRNVEVIDNDFGVAYDAAERFRKIRAIRSRLASTLGREPTDAEVLDAAIDPLYRGGHKIGRLNKTGAPPRRRITQDHLDQERDMRTRVGHADRFVDADDTTDTWGLTPDAGELLHHDPGTVSGTPDAVLAEATRDNLATLMRAAFDALRMGQTQRDIVSRRYGLAPHAEEQSSRDIARHLHLHRDKVTRVLDAFTTLMARPGGEFHQLCAAWDSHDLADMGLGWLPRVLGPYTGPEVAVDPAITAASDTLTRALFPRSRNPVAPAPERGGVAATFECSYHGAAFAGLYAVRADVPPQRACPRCGRASDLVGVAA